MNINKPLSKKDALEKAYILSGTKHMELINNGIKPEFVFDGDKWNMGLPYDREKYIAEYIKKQETKEKCI